MSFETAWSEALNQFGEITILFEFDKKDEVMGVAMNGIKKAPRKDLLTAVGFLDVVLSTGALSPSGRKLIQDAKIPLQNALATLPPTILNFPSRPG